MSAGDTVQGVAQETGAGAALQETGTSAALQETGTSAALQESSSRGKAPKAPALNPARHYAARFVFLVVVLIVVFVASVCMGRYSFSTPIEVWQVLSGSFLDWWDGVVALITGGTPSYANHFEGLDTGVVTSIMQVRFPRVVVGLLVGAALSIAGAAYQGVFQNPMVSQDVLGASSGAAFGAALAIWLAMGAGFITGLSFLFGVLAVVVSYSVSRISKSTPILALILSGMVVSALFSSCTSAIKLVADTDDALPAITYWLMGSLASIRVGDVLPCLLSIAIVSLPIILLRWRINLLATGEEEAKSLGMNTEGMRLIIIGCSTLLTAICVSVSGMIGWVGLVIPHFCRMMFGSDYRRIIPAAILMGASFLVVADDICRMALTSEIPIGILTSFVGAPIFIYLIARGGARGRK